MKAIKDKLVPSDIYYLVLSYLESQKFKPVIDMGVAKFDEKTGGTVFQMRMLNFDQFATLARVATEFMLNQSTNIPLEVQ